MAVSFNDLTQNLTVTPTFTPQSYTTSADGTGVDCAAAGTALINAYLDVGDVSTFTSLAVKMQASTDNVTFADITGATFTTVTAAQTTQMISFQLPTAASATTDPYRYVRATGTLVGTSCRLVCLVMFCTREPSPTLGYVSGPQTIN